MAQNDAASFEMPDMKALTKSARALPQKPAPGAPAFILPVPGESVDLISQFPRSREGQDQGQIGDCHDFAAVALMEAAYNRRYRQFRLLSVTDLFVHHTLTSPDAAADYIVAGRDASSPPVYEGGNTIGDVTYALERGVASQLDEPYGPFYRRYFKGDVPHLQMELTDAEDRKVRYYLNDASDSDVKRSLPKDSIFADDRSEIAANLILPEMGRIAARTDAQHPQAAVSREQSRQLLRGFIVGGRAYRTARDISADACLEKGQERMSLLVSELRKGRPVGVGMDVGGVWIHAPKEKANHEFVIRGYVVQPGGRVTFRTLNSWGKDKFGEAWDSYVFDLDLCRVYSITTLRAPGEPE